MNKLPHAELKKLMNKKLLKLNDGGRHVQGILWDFDPFMNLPRQVCGDGNLGRQNNMRMVVIRGNSIIMLKGSERV
ncbi:small nuclear ribonucleoprotein G-like [Mesocricetus auratus]|uniref:Small nuclear ribonucleoprotein G-like n=1 Tax=Mesocricetus auratus TaxID=10036 RepID=A0ABM2WWH3_MESAU|nr:small nuclear ribonucleoprotein G-like [Mesocricetus auratus]